MFEEAGRLLKYKIKTQSFVPGFQSYKLLVLDSNYVVRTRDRECDKAIQKQAVLEK
jgi:hypothetical protein